MKKLLSILIITVMLISLVPFAFATKDDFSTAPAIALGEKKDVSVSRTNMESVFKFVPQETAEYVFYSSSDSEADTYGCIMDKDGNIIDTNDDHYDLNFAVFSELEKDETYYLHSRLYYPMAKGDFTVTVSKTGTPATQIVLDNTDLIVYVGNDQSIYYTLSPIGCIYEDVTFTSSDPEVATVDSYGYVTGVKEGTAVITLKTENDVTATVNVTVKVPKQLTLDTPYSSTVEKYIDNDKFIFVPEEDGHYTINVTASSYAYLSAYGMEHSSGVDMSTSGYLLADEECHIELSSDNSSCDYTIEVVKTTPATDFYVFGSIGQQQCTAFSQLIFAEGVDGVVAGEVEWTVDDEETAAVTDTGCDYSYLWFSKPGTVTVTAKWNDISRTYTVTGYAPGEVTLSNPYTKEIVGFDDSAYATFTPETDGMYIISVDDSANAPFMLSVDAFGTTYNGVYNLPLNAGETYLISASRYQSSDDFASDITGNITISVAKAAEPTGIVIDSADEISAYVETEVYLEAVATNENALIGETIEWSVDTAAENCQIENWGNAARVYFSKVGEYTVTAKLGDFVDTVKVKVQDIPSIKLNTPVKGALNNTTSVWAANVDVDKPGAYAVIIKADAPVYVESAHASNYGNPAKNVEMAFAVLSNEEAYVTVYADGDTDVNFTIELVEASFPMGVRPDKKNVVLMLGEYYYPEVVFEPSSIREDIVSVQSSDTKVVDVAQNEIYAVGVGSATVKIVSEYGLTTEMTVTVVGNDYDWAQDISINKNEINLAAGASETLSVTVVADSDKKIEWISKDHSVARVDENGRVTGVAEGETYIEAWVDNLFVYCAVTVTEPEIKDSSKTFDDIKKGWYKNAVDYCYSYNFIAGTSATEFGRETNVNRGMFITILARIAGVDTTSAANKAATTKFTDVKTGKYYTAAIKWASENGVVSGTGEKTFSPEASISRQDLCVMISNFAKYMNIELKASKDEVAFTDASSIAKYAKNAVKACQMAGIVNGYTDGSFGPKKTATRAEAAQILYVFHSTFIAK